MSKSNFKTSPYNYNEDERKSVSRSDFAFSKDRYKNNFRDSGGLENQSVQELESYALYKAEETTLKVNGCLKIAEEIREDASRTLVTLHQQGEQITRTHLDAANIEHDLSRGEKLLGSLGGIFSKTWKPKKNRTIKGPVSIADNSFHRKASHTEQREKLGVTTNQKGRSTVRQPPSESASMLEKVEFEKVKQDDSLSDLSNLLGQLKEMAVDMGSEIERQNKALDGVDVDVEELTIRVKGANVRTRRLLGK
ncbi:SNAP25 homologous protein SNAP33-like [Dioscorea cayenensis subsp. rotundata]|uniref:SNAP25 homologous protein SNAP33-like n=1 Tax=Dioscorea cayennensis subsp. rotundata TaxID=55577 RepID=A0AB40CI43_DIOCR|nr:SNAP25 homologous protein SNAP33-like [Dioscorea cayenensis subsp. rotundata]XP_039139536.1 SNAP25 homologous protein SNAP33-like [Dioscorea cayenensis subsp. rotundata]